MPGMRYYNQLGIGRFFSFKKDLLNILERGGWVGEQARIR